MLAGTDVTGSIPREVAPRPAPTSSPTTTTPATTPASWRIRQPSWPAAPGCDRPQPRRAQPRNAHLCRDQARRATSAADLDTWARASRPSCRPHAAPLALAAADAPAHPSPHRTRGVTGTPVVDARIPAVMWGNGRGPSAELGVHNGVFCCRDRLRVGRRPGGKAHCGGQAGLGAPVPG